MAVTLADALTDFALLAVEGQQALHDEAGETQWEADLDQCRLWLGERPYDIAMIGTSSEISNTWMWSWANPGYGASHPAVSAILPGCAKGREAGIPEFAVESFSLEGVTDGCRGRQPCMPPRTEVVLPISPFSISNCLSPRRRRCRE